MTSPDSNEGSDISVRQVARDTPLRTGDIVYRVV
jgi:hypothetical protein